jgi:Domain of unknown function (DUF4133)
MSSVYQINKGINKAIEFKGLKAQYISYLAVGVLALLLLFVVLHICGVNMYVCLVLVGGAGTALFVGVFRLSARFGEHGLMKLRARRGVPACLKFRSRRVFLGLVRKGGVSS